MESSNELKARARTLLQNAREKFERGEQLSAQEYEDTINVNLDVAVLAASEGRMDVIRAAVDFNTELNLRATEAGFTVISLPGDGGYKVEEANNAEPAS